MVDLMPNRAPARARKDRPVTLIGWMEQVDLPDMPLLGLKAKIDTGARTSALHAHNIEEFTRDGAPWVRFQTFLSDGASDAQFEMPVHSIRAIKNTSGVPEHRVIVRTKARFGKRTWTVDLSLADRANMTFPIIIGRSALKNHAIAVHTRRAYLMTPKPASKKG